MDNITKMNLTLEKLSEINNLIVAIPELYTVNDSIIFIMQDIAEAIEKMEA